MSSRPEWDKQDLMLNIKSREKMEKYADKTPSLPPLILFALPVGSKSCFLDMRDGK